MSGRDYLGEFEHVVILALLRLGDRAYGVTVRQEIEARTGREASIGAVYATLDRLENKGYVKSQLGQRRSVADDQNVFSASPRRERQSSIARIVPFEA